MSATEENSDSETQIGGGRASIDSLGEYLKEFKSTRMSFEPLDTWLFVKARDDVESVSEDTNNMSASSESDSSIVYHFDSDEESSNDDDDDIGIAYDTANASVNDCNEGRDKGEVLIVKNLTSSPGRRGCGIKVFSEADKSDIIEEENCSFSDVFCSTNDIKCVQKYVTACNSHQSTLNSDFSVNAPSSGCSYKTYAVLSDYAPVTAHHHSISYSNCSKGVCNNSRDILEKFEASSEELSELACDISSVSHCHTNHVSVGIESPARAECNSSNIDSKAGISGTLKRNKKRQRISQELMDTEATYQRHLELIVQNFEDPLIASGLLSGQAVSAIFGNVREIIGINRELMRHLSTKNIGEAFLLLGPFLKLYSTYANNHEHALAALMDYEQKFPEFASFRRRQEELPMMNGLKLNALLITPVQRIPRYRLLLTDLLKNTLPDDDDYAALTEAVRQVSDVANHINDHIKQQDNFMRMLAIQKSLSCPVGPRILVPGRVFIKEGQLKKVSKRSSVGRMAERRFFLFSDILMYAKPRLLDGAASGAVRAWGGVSHRSSASPSLVCCCIMPLHHCHVQRVFGHSHGAGSNGQGTLFSITCKQESVLLFSDQRTVNSWIDALDKAIHECQLSRQTLRKTSSAKEPMRTRGIARMWKAEKHSDRLLGVIASPERPQSRTGETSSLPSSPGHLLSRLLFSFGDKEKSPACSSPNKSAQKHPILSCLNRKPHKRPRQVEPLSPNVNNLPDGTSLNSPGMRRWPVNL